MDGSKLLRNCLLLAVVFFFLSVNAAMPLVVIEPKEGEGIVSLYPFEKASYYIRVVNQGQEPVENLSLHVFVDPELAIVEDGKELSERSFSVFELQPGRDAIKEVEVKALQTGVKDFRISVDYGFDRFTHTVSTFLNVRPNPILINARLTKTALSPGEDASLILDITNTSAFDLNGIQAKLLVPDDVEFMDQPLFLEKLSPNSSYTNHEFRFRVGSSSVGRKDVVLWTVFSDREGRHTIERTFVVEVQNRYQYLFIIGGIIVALVLLSFLLRKPKKAEKIDTSGLEEEEPEPKLKPIHLIKEEPKK